MDSLLRKLGWFCIALNFVVVALYFNVLPDEIPRHFNASGQVDAYGSKFMLFLLPFIGLILYGFMNALSYRPEMYNYGVEITDDNREIQYDIAVRMVLLLNLAIAVVFLYINYAMVMIGLNKWTNLGKAFLPIMLLAIFGIIAWAVLQSRKHR